MSLSTIGAGGLLVEYFLSPGTPDRFLAKRQVNLIGGASGAGKTRLIFQLIKASTEGTDFMGMKTTPIKWAYVSGDRGAESVEETMESIGVKIPIFSMVDMDMVCGSLTKKVFPHLPGFLGYMPDMIFVDGFTSMVPGGEPNNYDAVAKWLASLQRYCQKLNLAILGSAHATKVREGDQIMDPRQRILGSSAWAGFAQDIIILDRVFKKDEGDSRVLNILRRNGREEVIKVVFKDGRLEIDNSVTEKAEGAAFVLEGLLTVGAKFESSMMEHLARQKGVSRATYYRWLHSMVECGRLVKETKGTYLVAAGPTEDILGNYETSKQSEEGQTNHGQDGSHRAADKSSGSDSSEEIVHRDLSEVLEDLQRGTAHAGDAEVREPEAPGEVRCLDGREEVRHAKRKHAGVSEDSNSRAADGDCGEDEESGD